MSAADDDPYELHARRFLARLQRLSQIVRTSDDDIDQLLAELHKCWPQILIAFHWAAAQRATPTGDEICQALVACAGGDAQVQYHRSAQELRRWSDAAADYARKLTDNPNDAAFLFRFAGIARVESTIVGIAQETRMQISDILGAAMQAVTESQTKRKTASEDAPKNG